MRLLNVRVGLMPALLGVARIRSGSTSHVDADVEAVGPGELGPPPAMRRSPLRSRSSRCSASSATSRSWRCGPSRRCAAALPVRARRGRAVSACSTEHPSAAPHRPADRHQLLVGDDELAARIQPSRYASLADDALFASRSLDGEHASGPSIRSRCATPRRACPDRPSRAPWSDRAGPQSSFGFDGDGDAGAGREADRCRWWRRRASSRWSACSVRLAAVQTLRSASTRRKRISFQSYLPAISSPAMAEL